MSTRTRQLRTVVPHMRHNEVWNDDSITDSHYLESFRMCKEDFKWLCNQLLPMLIRQRKGRYLSVEAQVAISLQHLGHGTDFFSLSKLYGVGIDTARKTVDRFVMAVIMTLGKKTIGYPPVSDVQAWNAIEQSFIDKRGLIGVVGAIDGTHIPIQKPHNDVWNSFINRKGKSK
jgi:hypothetical protein